MNTLLAEASALLADGIYVSGGVILLVLILILIWLLFLRGR